MMNYSRSLAAILGVGVVLVQMQPAQSLTKVEVSKVAQGVTVMIQNAQNPQDTGSGFIIKREGETYTVLTAQHVVKNSPAYTVLTPDKKQYPIIQGSIQPLPGVDLALVQFKSAGAYSVAKLGDSAQNPSGSASFVAGFPGTNEIRPEPEYYFTSGEIAANGSRPNKDGYALAYSNPTLPGMSGGPVLNDQGEVIGIHGQAERAERLQNSQFSNDIAVLKTEFNYAIPINTFLSLAPQVNKTLVLRIPSPSVPSAPKADDFFLQAGDKYKAGDFKGAISDYEQAIRIDPKSALAYINRGNARYKLGDKQGAISDYEQVIRIDPKYADAYYNRGVVRSALGDKQGAITDYDQAIRIDPKFAKAYNNRGAARYGLGDKQGAIADYEQAIRIDPKFAKAYNNRGAARYGLGDKQGAIADYEQAIRIDPKYADAYNNRGNARSALGDKQGAIADYDQAIRIDPKFAKAYYNRGVVRSALGDKQGAITDYDQAIRIDPKYADAYNNRGNARSALGDKQGAIADYDQAIRLDPKNAYAYNGRGYVRYALGDKQGAIADYQKAAALFKTQGDEKNYKAALKSLQYINGL
jgi:tetratricopeptide (TPR) repeat protein